MFRDYRLDLLGEIRLQVMIVLDAMVAHEGLNVRGFLPLLAVHFVAADVEECVREERGHFADEAVEKLVGCLARGIHGGIEDTEFSLDGVRAGAAGERRVSDEPTSGMAGHVEFRNHADAAVARVGDHVADLVLRVVVAVRALLLQLWIALAFNAEALVVREMPVEDV